MVGTGSRWRMLLVAALLSAAILGIAGGWTPAAPAATAPSTTDCDAVRGAPFDAPEGTIEKWLLIVAGTSCETGRSLVAQLTRRVTSSGTVDQVVFRLGDWSCSASRRSLIGGCSTLVKGAARYVIVLGAFTTNEIIKQQALRGTIRLDTLAPRPTTTETPAPTDGRLIPPPVRCSPVAGAPWVMPPPARRTGTRWVVYAGGGLSCLAAQGWVADLSPRIPGRRTGVVGDFIDGDWQCWTSGAGLLLGTCVRATSPRGPFDFRGVVIAPDGYQEGLPEGVVSFGFESALTELYRRRAADQSYLVAPRECGIRTVAGARWSNGAESTTRWLVGVRAYPCGLVLGSFLTQLAEWAAGPASTRVFGLWRCGTTPSSAAPGLLCNRESGGPLPAFTVVLLPVRPSVSREELSLSMTRALR